jgi:hypothetical protein
LHLRLLKETEKKPEDLLISSGSNNEYSAEEDVTGQFGVYITKRKYFRSGERETISFSSLNKHPNNLATFLPPP